MKDTTIYLTGNLNSNVIGYESNTKIKQFLKMLFQHGLLPVKQHV